jgi:hypothetical protein
MEAWGGETAASLSVYHPTLAPMHLTPGGHYVLFVYIEGDDFGREVGGTLGNGLHFSVPLQPSNSFSGASPRLVNDNIASASWEADYIHVEFTALIDGLATVFVVEGGTRINYVAEIRAKHRCNSTSEVAGQQRAQQVALRCTLEANTQFDAYVYIERQTSGDSGSLSAPIRISMPSNEFTVAPIVVAPVTPLSVGFRFTPRHHGFVWACIISAQDSAAHQMNVSVIKQPFIQTRNSVEHITVFDGNSVKCRVVGEPISEQEEFNLILRHCDGFERTNGGENGLRPGGDYTLYVYVEDVNRGAGTLSQGVHFRVGSTPSIAFVGGSYINEKEVFQSSPIALTGNTILGIQVDSIGVDFILPIGSPADPANVWARIYPVPASAHLDSLERLKSDPNAAVCTVNAAYMTGRRTGKLPFPSSCVLEANVDYDVIMYAEAGTTESSPKVGAPGTLAAPSSLRFASNRFIFGPIVTRPITLDGFMLEFTPLYAGYVWAIVVSAEYASLVNESTLLNGNFLSTNSSAAAQTPALSSNASLRGHPEHCRLTALPVSEQVRVAMPFYNCATRTLADVRWMMGECGTPFVLDRSTPFLCTSKHRRS